MKKLKPIKPHHKWFLEKGDDYEKLVAYFTKRSDELIDRHIEATQIVEMKGYFSDLKNRVKYGVRQDTKEGNASKSISQVSKMPQYIEGQVKFSPASATLFLAHLYKMEKIGKNQEYDYL